MSVRLLVAAPNDESLALYRALINSAESLLPLGLDTDFVSDSIPTSSRSVRPSRRE